ncbi:MFS transporter [Streptomyces sp. NPDC046985]|uniref:MFS transporter n=1 Tax=Streptomyces sp. NPDC046985 TaxID=3155377 RepID=UPI00340E600A
MSHTAPAGAASRPGLIITALAIVAAVSALQQAVVVPILPRLQVAFDTSLASVSWALTVSLLVGAIATPIAGRLGDMLGHKKVLVGVVALLVLGSVVGAVGTSLPMFLVARVLQGCSAAVVPLSIGLLRGTVPASRLGFGIGVVAAMVGAGNGLGLLLAGVVSQMGLGYQPLFWIMVAVAAIGLLLAGVCVPAGDKRSDGKLDLGGAGLLSGALLSLLLAVGQGSAWGWDSPVTLGLFAAAVVLGTALAVFESRVGNPLVDIAMLRDRRTVGATSASLFLGFGLFGAFFLVPSFVQHPAALGYGFGASALGAAVYLLPTTVLMLVISLVSGRVVKKLSAAWTVALGSTLTSGALVMLALFHSDSVEIYIATSVMGLGIGLSFAALGTMSVEHVSPDQTAAANGVNSLARMIGGSIAAPVITAILAAGSASDSASPRVGGYAAGFAVAAVGAAVAAVTAAVAVRANRTVDPRKPVDHSAALAPSAERGTV